MLDILHCTISNQYEPFVCFKNVSIIWRDIQVHSKQESFYDPLFSFPQVFNLNSYHVICFANVSAWCQVQRHA